MEKKFKRFKPGDEVYLKSVVHEVDPGNGYDYSILWKDSVDHAACMLTVGEGQLFPADEITDEPGIDWQATYNEYSEKAQRTIASLSKRITELSDLLKEAQAKADNLNSALKEQDGAYADVVSKNAALTKQNRELEERLSNGKGDVEHWRKKYMGMKATCNEYKRFVSNVEAERDYAEKELALTRIMNIALAEKIERMQNG